MGDEKQARHVLADMQARLARSAYDALNIPAGDVAPEQVRSAFLELTKTYHPAKFARMAPELYKLANEVFLGLRAAYDQLSRQRTTSARQQSGPMPFIPAKTPGQGTAAIPVVRPPATRANMPPAPTSAIAPPTQRGVPPAPTSSIAPPTQRGVAPASTAQRPAISTSQQPPLARPGTAPATSHRPGTQPATQQIRRMTPAGGVPAQPAPPIRRVTPAGGVPAQPAPAAATAKEPELAGVYDQLSKGQWEQARQTLHALIALQPRPRYHALLQYSLGREAQLSRRLDEARVELQGALEIDPDLQLAKTALAELFTRRK